MWIFLGYFSSLLYEKKYFLFFILPSHLFFWGLGVGLPIVLFDLCSHPPLASLSLLSMTNLIYILFSFLPTSSLLQYHSLSLSLIPLSLLMHHWLIHSDTSCGFFLYNTSPRVTFSFPLSIPTKCHLDLSGHLGGNIEENTTKHQIWLNFSIY